MDESEPCGPTELRELCANNADLQRQWMHVVCGAFAVVVAKNSLHQQQNAHENRRRQIANELVNARTRFDEALAWFTNAFQHAYPSRILDGRRMTPEQIAHELRLTEQYIQPDYKWRRNPPHP